MLLKLNQNQYVVNDIINDDPVRPHISAEWRVSNGREVYGLYADESFEDLRAVICVAYTDKIPETESDMDSVGTKFAVFYTVWSYDRGAGRDSVFTVAKHVKDTKTVDRYVTLSPQTEMARKFHLSNGATELSVNSETINYEYDPLVI